MLSQLRARESATYFTVAARLTTYSQMCPWHSGSGEIFDLVRTVDADAKAHATATTRTIVLTARFMAFSLHAGSLGAETLIGGNYSATLEKGIQKIL